MRAIRLLFLSLLLFSAAGRSEVYLVSVTGTITTGTDRGASSANRQASIFGRPGVLDGTTYALEITIDDGVGTPATGSFADGSGTGLAGTGSARPVRSSITVNGVTRPIGNSLPVVRKSSTRRLYLPDFGARGRSIVEFVIDESRDASASPEERRQLFIQISNDVSSQGEPPFVDSVDWRQPFTRALAASDDCNQCRFSVTQADPDGRRVQAVGRLAVSSIVITRRSMTNRDVPNIQWLEAVRSSWEARKPGLGQERPRLRN